MERQLDLAEDEFWVKVSKIFSPYYDWYDVEVEFTNFRRHVIPAWNIKVNGVFVHKLRLGFAGNRIYTEDLEYFLGINKVELRKMTVKEIYKKVMEEVEVMKNETTC